MITRSVRHDKMARVIWLQLKIEAIARSMELDGYVRHKVNAAGALVVALIVPAKTPREWTHVPPAGPTDRPPKQKERSPQEEERKRR